MAKKKKHKQKNKADEIASSTSPQEEQEEEVRGDKGGTEEKGEEYQGEEGEEEEEEEDEDERDDHNGDGSTSLHDDGNSSALKKRNVVLNGLFGRRPSSPPSHILANGTHVHLPKPTSVERSGFFQRAIATYNLVSAQKENQQDDDENDDGDGGDKDDDEVENDENKTQRKTKYDRDKENEQENEKNGEKKNSDGTTPTGEVEPTIHPLAVASARLQGCGISELSKAINLSSLVGSGEYFSIANIVSNADIQAATASVAAAKVKAEAEGKAGGGGDGSKAGSASEMDSEANVREQDPKLRAGYLLKRKRDQFDDAANALDLHRCRLLRSLALQRIVDRRLLALRKQWRLAAPEHGTRAIGPVRPSEVIAVDVEVYDRDRVGGGTQASMGGGEGKKMMGRVARMVPRYATIELSSIAAGKKESLFSSSKENGTTKDDAEMKENTNNDNEESEDETHGKNENEASSKSASQNDEYNRRQEKEEEGVLRKKYRTKAEPYAVADPTLGKIDLDFDPDKVPMLTLLLIIEKNSTGFTQSAQLTSFTAEDKSGKGGDHEGGDGVNKKDGNDDDDETKMNATKKNGSSSGGKEDESVLESLQHSLFCASLFDTLRQEIASSNTSSATPVIPTPSQNPVKNKKKGVKKTSVAKSASAVSNKAKGRPTVWLSSEMDEAFFPSPFHMSGDGCSGGGIGGAPFCVVHCQEGEVKVQLDSEYAITFQLVEAGSVSNHNGNVSSSSSSSFPTAAKPAAETSDKKNNSESGSQSPRQLMTLCRALLLRAQFVYHDHCMKTQAQIMQSSNSDDDNDHAAAVDMERRRLRTLSALAPTGKDAVSAKIVPSPRILQLCVTFGARVLLEGKIRSVLKRLAQWIKSKWPTIQNPLLVEWLPLSYFDTHSHFTLNVADGIFSADVHIEGGSMRVVTMVPPPHCTGNTDENYRFVRFASAVEFEQYLILAIRARLDGRPSNFASTTNTSIPMAAMQTGTGNPSVMVGLPG